MERSHRASLNAPQGPQWKRPRRATSRTPGTWRRACAESQRAANATEDNERHTPTEIRSRSGNSQTLVRQCVNEFWPEEQQDELREEGPHVRSSRSEGIRAPRSREMRVVPADHARSMPPNFVRSCATETHVTSPPGCAQEGLQRIPVPSI